MSDWPSRTMNLLGRTRNQRGVTFFVFGLKSEATGSTWGIPILQARQVYHGDTPSDHTRSPRLASTRYLFLSSFLFHPLLLPSHRSSFDLTLNMSLSENPTVDLSTNPHENCKEGPPYRAGIFLVPKHGIRTSVKKAPRRKWEDRR